MISVRHLCKEYANATPLKDVNVDIKRGEVVSIIGPSGTGKSTFLRMLNRLEEPTSGTIIIDGIDTGAQSCEISQVRQKMGMVFQNFNLFKHMNIIENIMYAPMKVLGLSKEHAYKRGMKLLRIVGLEDKELNYPDELSGGQKQRIAIARTLAMKPEIILFDEPTSALDPTMVGEVVAVIHKLAQEGMTMLIVTHEMWLARIVSTRVLYLDQGIIYEDGTPKEIFDNPQKELTRRFVNGQHIFEKTLVRNDLDYLGFLSEINQFALKNLFAPRFVYRLEVVIDEVYRQSILPVQDENERLNFILEYSEKQGTCHIRFSWDGKEYNPLENMSEESRRQLEDVSNSSEYIYTENKKNEVYITVEE